MHYLCTVSKANALMPGVKPSRTSSAGPGHYQRLIKSGKTFNDVAGYTEKPPYVIAATTTPTSPIIKPVLIVLRTRGLIDHSITVTERILCTEMVLILSVKALTIERFELFSIDWQVNHQ